MGNRPYLDPLALAALVVGGGYTNTVNLSEASSVLLLSACTVLRMRFLWEDPIDPISDALYDAIQFQLDQTEYELMANFSIGTIFGSVAILTTDNVQPCIGQLLAQSDYPELTAVVPAGWLVGSDIQLPDMRDMGLFGATFVPDLGVPFGSNTHTLTEAEMPSHTHTQNPHTHTYTDQVITPELVAPGPVPTSLVTPLPSSTGPATAINNNTGGDQPHNNVQSSLQVGWWIIVR